mmetsp:Transcript_52821/g.63584  ORF Transcript_52821/g.63584 Transcript_52821/m.63584 type:complete len:88 (+) Transcript_52821:137-400(+)
MKCTYSRIELLSIDTLIFVTKQGNANHYQTKFVQQLSPHICPQFFLLRTQCPPTISLTFVQFFKKRKRVMCRQSRSGIAGYCRHLES